MKTFITALLVLAFATQAMAATTLGFRAYSSASTVGTTCALALGTKTADGAFTATSLTTLNLGTKGTAAVTLVYSDYDINCYATSTGAAVKTKMFFDTEGTTYFPVTSYTLRYR